jgi:hypothetical protein
MTLFKTTTIGNLRVWVILICSEFQIGGGRFQINSNTPTVDKTKAIVPLGE